MILTVNIGNTSVTIGVYQNRKHVEGTSVTADSRRSADEYAVNLKGVLNLNGVDEKKITGCIISSVVPPLTPKVRLAVEKLTGIKAIVVGPGIKTGFPLKIDQQTQLGSDIVACASGALLRNRNPAVLLYFGTAITISVLDQSGALMGAAITPGLQLALDSLSTRTAQLPRISLEAPKYAIGRNTEEAMKSGVIFGTAAMIDGMIARITKELAAEQEPLIIATGSMAELIVPSCQSDIIIDPNLLHDGLCALYNKNIALYR